MRIGKFAAICAIAFMLMLGNAQAKEKYAVGLQSTYVTSGISGKYLASDKLALQAVLGSGWLSNDVLLRGLFAFKEEDQYKLYGAAGLGVQLYRTGTALDINGAVGIETNWQNWIEDIFP